jgi:hypothetical protein
MRAASSMARNSGLVVAPAQEKRGPGVSKQKLCCLKRRSLRPNKQLCTSQSNRQTHKRTDFGERGADALARAVAGQLGRELALSVASLPVSTGGNESAAGLRVVAPRSLHIQSVDEKRFYARSRN